MRKCTAPGGGGVWRIARKRARSKSGLRKGRMALRNSLISLISLIIIILMIIIIIMTIILRIHELMF